MIAGSEQGKKQTCAPRATISSEREECVPPWRFLKSQEPKTEVSKLHREAFLGLLVFHLPLQICGGAFLRGRSWLFSVPLGALCGTSTERPHHNITTIPRRVEAVICPSSRGENFATGVTYIPYIYSIIESVDGTDSFSVFVVDGCNLNIRFPKREGEYIPRSTCLAPVSRTLI